MGAHYSTPTPSAGLSARTGTPRWRGVVVLVATVLAAGVTARLGLWQLSRAAQKASLAEALAVRGALPPLPQRELAKTPTEALAQHHRRVRLQGQWEEAATVYLENRQMNGRPGFFVLTPLRLADGDAVMVQRGWVPRDMQDRARVPALTSTEGTVSVLARVAPPPAKLYDFTGAAATGPIRQNIDLDEFARERGLVLRPLSLMQLDDWGQASVSFAPASSPMADGLLRQWPAPTSDVAKHHGYAFQWFALCALITGLYVWFQLIRPRIHARRPG